MFDYLIVGAGFAGSVLAERLATVSNQRVLIIDKRPHRRQRLRPLRRAGVLIHKYGPHIFHTNSRQVFDYLSQFTEWRPYQHRVLAASTASCVPMPINLDTINKLYGLNLTSFELEKFFESVAEKVTLYQDLRGRGGKQGRPRAVQQVLPRLHAQAVGPGPVELDASVTARVPTRTNRDDRYFTDTFQAMPLHGYTRMFEKMLDHPNIKVMLNTDYREMVDLMPWKHMVYTGPVDAFFDYKYGKLPYRSLEFKHETLNKEQFQPRRHGELPQRLRLHPHQRVQAHHRAGAPDHLGGVRVPARRGRPVLPGAQGRERRAVQAVRSLADATPNVTFVGRLATYKYYNMDQVVAQARRRHQARPARHLGQHRAGRKAYQPRPAAAVVSTGDEACRRSRP
jgi:UDP-galactopyranose mutase